MSEDERNPFSMHRLLRGLPTPLPTYAGHEQLRGRLRAPIPRALFVAAFDRDGHDSGDEDRYGGLP